MMNNEGEAKLRGTAAGRMGLHGEGGDGSSAEVTTARGVSPVDEAPHAPLLPHGEAGTSSSTARSVSFALPDDPQAAPAPTPGLARAPAPSPGEIVAVESESAPLLTKGP